MEEAEKQRIIALESILFDQRRTHRVAYPLLLSAASIAPERTRPYLGVFYANKYSFAQDFQETAARQYGLDEKLSILEVIPDSPAEFAGLMAGDRLLLLNRNRCQPVGRLRK
jgi:S1-C subfamily serine protease